MYTKDGFHKALEQKLGDDAYLLLANGGHKKLAELLTAASLGASGNTTTLSVTVGGTTKTGSVTVPYASAAAKWATARTLTIGSTGKSVDGSGNVSWTLDEIGVYSKTTSDDRFVNVTGDWMNWNAQLSFKGKGESTSVYSRIGYATSASGQTMHCINSSGHQADGAFYIISNGSTSANDTGGLAIDNEGVTIFGAGDAGSNFTGVFRVLNEDNVADGPQFIVTKASGVTTKYSHTAQRFISNIGTGTQPYACSSTTVNTNLNADMTDGLHVHTGRNNEANKLVRTDGNGYIQAGYINSSSGDENNNSSPARVWGTNGSDSYLRTYRTSALSVGNADTLDNIHANGLLTAASLGTSGNNTTLSVTVGGTTKTGSVTVPYATSAGNADTVDSLHAADFVRAYTTDNNNIDTDWGQSFKTFDPIPSGTPPEQNANISLLSIGNNFARRKQLAFMYNNDNIYYRRCVDNSFTSWVKLIHSGNIGSQSVSYASSAGNANYATGAGSAGSASYASSAGNANYATNAGSATNANYAARAGRADSAGTASNASYASNAGSANSAAKWSTARTLTIGSTGKTVDGSANVSWTLAEIGAAASGHNHDSEYIRVINNTSYNFDTVGTYIFIRKYQHAVSDSPGTFPPFNYNGSWYTLMIIKSYAENYEGNKNAYQECTYSHYENSSYRFMQKFYRYKNYNGGWSSWYRML